MSTLYDTLGVSKSASADEIKKAYRKLAREHHPDRNPGDSSAEGKFKEIQHAYDVLGDDDKRKQYDRFGAQNGRPGPGGPGGGQNINFDFGEICVTRPAKVLSLKVSTRMRAVWPRRTRPMSASSTLPRTKT